MSLFSQIESILFVASQPLSYSVIAKALDADVAVVQEVVEQLRLRYNTTESGLHVFVVDETVRLGTNPDNIEVVEKFTKDEVAGELTKAQLETLTVVAYRGPITRPELEQIRGVNCAIILRNLQIRGLVDERNDDQALAPVYVISFEAMRHLGITSVEELSEYDVLRAHPHLDNILSEEYDDAHS